VYVGEHSSFALKKVKLNKSVGCEWLTTGSFKKTFKIMKELFLLRGLPGSGKSTLAKSLGGEHFEADMYFVRNGEYKFDASKLSNAHKWCKVSVEECMNLGYKRVIVSNTFTQEWEMKPYYEMAEEYGYRVYSLIVENRHGGVNEHGVPDETLEKMENRFQLKLR
jgi:energy-coupling factor transporter ATP-binding protein EcfA2